VVVIMEKGTLTCQNDGLLPGRLENDHLWLGNSNIIATFFKLEHVYGILTCRMMQKLANNRDARGPPDCW
jgi:hypothetical protein